MYITSTNNGYFYLPYKEFYVFIERKMSKGAPKSPPKFKKLLVFMGYATSFNFSIMLFSQLICLNHAFNLLATKYRN